MKISKSHIFPTAVQFFLILQSLAQPAYDNFRLSPSKPEAGHELQIEYSPISALLAQKINAFVLFNQLEQKWPTAIEVPMVVTGENLIGKVSVSSDDISFLVVFIDSLGNVVDNNNDAGYWSPLYKSGNIKLGGLSSIANLYYGVAKADLYKIKPDRDLAKSLYEQEFVRNSELKRFYHLSYISSIRYDKEQSLWLNEINQFSGRDDLTDWELMEVSRKFKSINDTTSSKKINSSIPEKFPLGEWSLQLTSMDYQQRYSKSNDALERMRIASDHFKRFNNWPMTEDKVRYLETVAIVYFLKHIEDYIDLGNLEEWKVLAGTLRNRAQYSAYCRASKRLIEKELHLKQAEELIEEATRWREKNLSAPRASNDWPYLSEREVRFNREKELSEWLEVYAQALRLQGKNEEARAISEKAELYAAHQAAKLLNRPPAKLISKPLPAITFSDSNKKPVELSAYKGKTIVLDFWATWCAPCIAGFKKMGELENKFSKENTVFLFVNTHEKGNETEIRKRAEKLLKERELSFKVLYDPQSKSASHFDFNALPTTIVIDKEGMIRYQQTGISEDSNLEGVLSQLISAK